MTEYPEASSLAEVASKKIGRVLNEEDLQMDTLTSIIVAMELSTETGRKKQFAKR